MVMYWTMFERIKIVLTLSSSHHSEQAFPILNRPFTLFSQDQKACWFATELANKYPPQNVEEVKLYHSVCCTLLRALKGGKRRMPRAMHVAFSLTSSQSAPKNLILSTNARILSAFGSTIPKQNPRKEAYQEHNYRHIQKNFPDYKIPVPLKGSLVSPLVRTHIMASHDGKNFKRTSQLVKQVTLYYKTASRTDWTGLNEAFRIDYKGINENIRQLTRTANTENMLLDGGVQIEQAAEKYNHFYKTAGDAYMTKPEIRWRVRFEPGQYTSVLVTRTSTE
ncbi:MAG: hypothetical protein Q9208_003881 [Pyrenodesmia sp. 3 TL-2023]